MMSISHFIKCDYLQKNSMSVSKEDLILYRGIANIGKKQGIMPHRKWRQEFDIT